MTRVEAADILGITDINERSVSEAYRDRSKTCHPNGLTPDLAMWERLSAARAALMAPPPRCRHCKGTGRITSGGLRMFCDMCHGKGESK